MTNFWDDLMGTDEGAASYMALYGEGIGSDTRHTLSAFINDGESVLDVGCGPGWNLDHFIENGPKISKYRGVDYSERFVRVANKRWSDKGWDVPWERNPRNWPIFWLGDCRNLDEANDTFDVVILQDVLEHTNGYEKPIQEALRVASKRVIITMWHLADEENEHINDDSNDGWGAWYNGNQFKEFLDNTGFPWMETQSKPTDNRQHRFFIIEKHYV